MEKLLIIGGTGSLGTCLLKLLSSKYEIIILSRDENKQWLLKQKYPSSVFILGDIRNREVIEERISELKPDRIIIASALKHIDICERNVAECIATNVIGIQNVINAISHLSNMNAIPNLKVVCFLSTDKAVSPVNVYGMCKSLAERIVVEKSLTHNQASLRSRIKESPRFVIVRYGNVLSSRGSIIPLFHKIGKDKNRDCFPVTDFEMTRFFLTLEDGVNLIERAMDEGESGDTYVPKIKSYDIYDIAKLFSKRYNKPIQLTGIRPGEKLHECLINESERIRTIKKDNIYIIKPCYTPIEVTEENSVDFNFEYTSNRDVSSSENLNIDIEEI